MTTDRRVCRIETASSTRALTAPSDAGLPDSRAVSGTSPSDVDTETEAGWLSPESLEQVRAHVPLVYVDAVPVRVDGRGEVTEVGLLLRQAADGTISRMVVSGRVMFGERIRDALLRHLEKDLGPMAFPDIPPDPSPFTVVEYFPDPRALRLPRPPPPRRQPRLRRSGRRRLHADARGARPRLVHARRSGRSGRARADDRRPRPPDPTGPRPLRRAAVTAAASVSPGVTFPSTQRTESGWRPLRGIDHSSGGVAYAEVSCRRGTPSNAPRRRCVRRSSTRR